MKKQNFITSIIILLFLILIAGCSVGIRPAYYDLPPIDDNQNYYGEPAYNSIYVPSSEYKYEYSSAYDPWTMSNYYDYTSPQRVSRDSQASTSSGDSASIGERRPTTRDRSTSLDQSAMAPKKDNTAIRRERTIPKESTDTNSGSSDSTTTHKARRELNNNNSSTNASDSSNSQQSSSDKKDDEEKQKRKRGVTN